MEGLTPKQRDILEYLLSCKSKGYIPSTAELAEKFSFTSRNSARNHLKALEKKGYIRLLADKKRSMEILVEEMTYKKGIEKVYDSPNTERIPILAYDHLIEDQKGGSLGYISIDTALFKGKNLKAVKVEGDLMIEAGINDADLVIVSVDAEVEEADIALVILDKSEVLLCELLFDEDGIVIHFLNPVEEEMIILKDKAKERLRIYGKVIGVLRSVVIDKNRTGNVLKFEPDPFIDDDDIFDDPW